MEGQFRDGAMNGQGAWRGADGQRADQLAHRDGRRHLGGHLDPRGLPAEQALQLGVGRHRLGIENQRRDPVPCLVYRAPDGKAHDGGVAFGGRNLDLDGGSTTPMVLNGKDAPSLGRFLIVKGEFLLR